MSVGILESKIPKFMEKPPKLGEYDGKGDPDEHFQLINEQLNYFNADEAYKCKMFALTLVRPARLWFNGLPDMSIKSWNDFYEWFYMHFSS